MSEQIAKNRLFALKADLERLGCKVAIFQHADVDMFEVTIVYPVDVPPPPRKWTPEELELQKARMKSVDDVVGDDDDDDDYDDEEES